MKRFWQQFVSIGVGLGVLLILAIGAQQIGGVSLRSGGFSQNQDSLNLPEVWLPGIATQILVTQEVKEIVLKTRRGERVLGEVEAEELILVEIPCELGEDDSFRATIVTRSENGQVLESARITVLPAGRECAL